MSIPRRRLESLDPERICIVKPSSLGDVVHALPILSALRSRWPHSKITWVVNRGYHDVLRGHSDLDDVLLFDRPRGGIDERAVAAMLALWQRLRDDHYDLTIDLQGLLRSGLLVAATRSPVRVGPADAREGARWLYTDRVDAPRRRMHAVDRALRFGAAFGAPAVEPQFRLPIGPDDHRWAEAQLAAVPWPRLILTMGARWLTKRWPPEHFAEIGNRAASEYGATLLAVGSAEDRPLVDAVRRHLVAAEILDFCGRTRLKQLAALALQCDLMISNDTGPLHLAAAAGARVLGIYTCTNPTLTGPYGPHAATVQSCVWCAPSFIRTCRRLDCMSELSPDRVWPVVKEQLERALATTPRDRPVRKEFEPSVHSGASLP
jgi:lipopolysaccharide heptosyltransferase I